MFDFVTSRDELNPTVVPYVAMRRPQAIFVIVALLATPLALVAHGMAEDAGGCDRMCCLRHATHPAAEKSVNEGMACHHSAAGRKCECAISSGGSPIDYGFLAPIVPTSPSAIVSILNPQVFREYFARFSESTPSGFPSAPFEPPRA
jgi:hypothetical protein